MVYRVNVMINISTRRALIVATFCNETLYGSMFEMIQ